MKRSFNLFMTMLLGTVLLFPSCKSPAGEEAEVSDAAEVQEASGMEYTVSVDESVINWEGAKPTATHTGTVAISDGKIVVDNNTIAGGSFTIDLSSINVTDLEGRAKENLEAHLKGTVDEKADDFFNVRKYPTAEFEITKVTALSNDPNATHLIYGNLNIKETSKEVGFKANVQMADGEINVTTPQFTIDRTLWGINFGSASLPSVVKDKAIDDNIGLNIELKASAPTT